MKAWMKFFETLAGKLTAILAFAILLVVLLALIGNGIPGNYMPLVYVVAIGAMMIFAYQVFVRSKSSGASGENKANAPASGNSKPADARERYLRAVIADCRPLRLVGIDPQASDPTRGGLTLESLYISLDTTTSVDRKTKKTKSKGQASEDEEQEKLRQFIDGGEKRPLGALEALSMDNKRHIVLLGLPGTGKSTFVRYLALRMAQAEVDRSLNVQNLLPDWQGGAILPVIISLGRFAETIPADCKQGSAKLVENYIVQSLKNDERMADFADQVLDELEKRGGLALFDGLDEVADLHLRPIVVQSVEDFVEHYKRQPVNRFLVTCRTYSYHNDTRWQLTGWSTYELALFDDKKIEDFVEAWHNEHARIEPARKADYENKRERLLASLHDDRRRLYEIAPFPIILTMMAVVHTHYNGLPDSRAEVYERCVDLLLIRWELERPVSGMPSQTRKRTILDELGIDRTVLDRALWEIAFEAHAGRQADGEKKRGPALVTEDLLTSVLWKNFPEPKKEKVQTFLDYCQSSNGLLMLQGSVAVPNASPETPLLRVYAFPHLTFEEFLAARHLLSRPNFGKITRELVQKDERWREVVILLGEFINFAQNDTERMETLLSALTPEKAPTKIDHPDWRSVWYSGDLLALYKRNHFQEKATAEERIRKGLFALVTKGALSPIERAAAADTLDELGYRPNDLHAFLPIPGQKYYFSKYLVTNLQYERFLKPENFANKNYWMDFPKYDENSQPMQSQTWGSEAWDWLQKALKGEEDTVENGILYPRYWRDPRFGSARRTAPVVGVSWVEASAYCKWLLENWEGLEEGKQGLPKPDKIRLPLEVEWETAAGGMEPKERFAWGVLKNEKEITHFANTSEGGLNKTTPVWMYPQGASPHKLMDMSGNVWEWQANFYDKDHDYLGLRGGSWGYDQDLARVAVRSIRYHPHLRLDFIGFRVVFFPSG